MSSMISIVRSFGAPVIEPPGKHAHIAVVCTTDEFTYTRHQVVESITA